MNKYYMYILIENHIISGIGSQYAPHFSNVLRTAPDSRYRLFHRFALCAGSNGRLGTRVRPQREHEPDDEAQDAQHDDPDRCDGSKAASPTH